MLAENRIIVYLEKVANGSKNLINRSQLLNMNI
jgi:hypothetical protein